MNKVVRMGYNQCSAIPNNQREGIMNVGMKYADGPFNMCMTKAVLQTHINYMQAFHTGVVPLLG